MVSVSRVMDSRVMVSNLKFGMLQNVKQLRMRFVSTLLHSHVYEWKSMEWNEKWSEFFSDSNLIHFKYWDVRMMVEKKILRKLFQKTMNIQRGLLLGVYRTVLILQCDWYVYVNYSVLTSHFTLSTINFQKPGLLVYDQTLFLEKNKLINHMHLLSMQQIKLNL